MKHIKALIIKFILVTAILWVVLGVFYDVSFSDILTTSVFLTVAAYLIGDLFILPRFGNTAATTADFGLAWLGIYVLGAAMYDPNIWLAMASLISALGIAIGEIFFHRSMRNNILDENPKYNTGYYHDTDMLTEFSSETAPEKNDLEDRRRE